MRLLTKQDRENSRKYQFDSLLKNGYQKTEYKNLIVFAHPTELLLKSFWGTAANHTDFYKYRTIEQMNAKIESLKQTADAREKRKAEEKERNKGKSSSHAAASAAIKAELKTAFPSVKFSVRSDSFAGGDSVDISWTDGPTTDEVERISSKYQYGHFDAMNDIYEGSNYRDDIPQAKYVQEHRTLSESITEAVKLELMKVKTYTDEQLTSYRESPEQEARQILYNTHIPVNYTSLQLVDNDADFSRNYYKVVFDTPEQSTTPEPPKGKIQIVDYSEKAFAVIGEFSEHYDNLLNLGGTYNKFLKCGRGIIFSKSKLEAVKNYLISTKKEETKEPEQPQQPSVEINEADILPVPDNNPLTLDYFKIIWHEGWHIDRATFKDAVFITWEEVQRAFFILWQVNEKGQNGGYTKVKCEMKLTGADSEIFRVDITDKHFNGDFNPSLQHIAQYLLNEMEVNELPTPKIFENV